MRVNSIRVENFGSYKYLNFSLDSKGLVLVQGPTGAGKSTLYDIIPWILFGKTSKGGSVDEVRNWSTTEPTKGTIWLDNVTISRTRGTTKDNDLMIWLTDDKPTRGKDITDTQKLINEALGFNYETYVSASYFHEFSQVSQFFTTTAKIRRTITEQLTDLTLANKLQERISEENRTTKQVVAGLETEVKVEAGKHAMVLAQYKLELQREEEFEATRDKKLTLLSEKARTFESNKAERIGVEKLQLFSIIPIKDEIYAHGIEEVQKSIPANPEKCASCGTPKISQDTAKKLKDIEGLKMARVENSYKLKDYNRIRAEIQSIEKEENTYTIQIEELKNATNPYCFAEVYSRLSIINDKLDKAKDNLADSKQRKTDLETLSTIVDEFRGMLIQNVVLDIESQTNLLLNKHFDAEMKIKLEIKDADKLEVTIEKDGNEASFTQLSKGQRQILKLCFSIAAMRAVGNHHGIKFNTLWFDEAMDGMDDTNKLKCVSMFESLTLEYETILLVDHSETVKAMVNNKINVELEDGTSTIWQN